MKKSQSKIGFFINPQVIKPKNFCVNFLSYQVLIFWCKSQSLMNLCVLKSYRIIWIFSLVFVPYKCKLFFYISKGICVFVHLTISLIFYQIPIFSHQIYRPWLSVWLKRNEKIALMCYQSRMYFNSNILSIFASSERSDFSPFKEFEIIS
jgi:hypothetical protein